MDDALCCPVCLDVFTDPRSLPCGHTFCFECTNGLLQIGGTQMVCALCRKSWKNLERRSLPCNFILNDVLEQNRLSGTPLLNDEITQHLNQSQEGTCCFCQSKTEWYCTKCDSFICQPCSPKHKEFPMTKTHPELTKKSSCSSKSTIGTETSQIRDFCMEHQCAFISFCFTCEVLLCGYCLQLKHKEHQVESIEASISKRKKFLFTSFPDLSEASNTLDQYEKDKKEFEIKKNKLEEELECLQRKMKQTTEKLSLLQRNAISSASQHGEMLKKYSFFWEMEDKDLLDTRSFLSVSLKLRNQSATPASSFSLPDAGFQLMSSMNDIPLQIRGISEQGRVIGKAKRQKGNFGARFIKDVQCYDGTLVSPSTRFTKIWLIKNTGSLQWPLGTELEVLPNGDLCNIVPAIVPEVKPGDEVLLSVSCTTPAKEGNFVSHFRLYLPNGAALGDRLWVKVNVVHT